MPTKRCSWGKCNSDSRYRQKPHMVGVTFFPFAKPWMNLERCRSWVKACARPHDQLNADKIARHHNVCSKLSAILVFTYIYFVHIYNKIQLI